MKIITILIVIFCFESCINKYHYIKYDDSKTRFTGGYFSGINYLLVKNNKHDTLLEYSLQYIKKDQSQYFYPEMIQYDHSKTKIKMGILFTSFDVKGGYYYGKWPIQIENVNENGVEKLTERELNVYRDAINRFCSLKKSNSKDYLICDSIPKNIQVRRTL
ncbi:MAG: hypothetical protein H6605_10815 [Flavobacteriales bacterium]|nr:hypothetical protein [Flavobacteriales bacterium]